LIEVNLLPGGRKRSSKARGFSFTLPKFGGGGAPAFDPYIAGAVAAGIVSLGLMAWLFVGVRSQKGDLQVQVTEAQHDSARFGDVIKRTNELRARRDSIAKRVSIIQDIDENRYVWPHVLDEVSRALPDYTWLTAITQISADPSLQIRISGTSGSNFAITTFMRRLEASPFFSDVQLQRSEQSVEAGNNLVYVFELTVTYESPPLDQLHTVPLFEDRTGGAAADSTGG
jgi:Tfp pilus assembly protein PilN